MIQNSKLCLKYLYVQIGGTSLLDIADHEISLYLIP